MKQAIKLTQLQQLLNQVLQIDKRIDDMNTDTRLLELPEFDSMAAIAIISELEKQWGIQIEDDEISIDIFATIGDLLIFINQKVTPA